MDPDTGNDKVLAVGDWVCRSRGRSRRLADTCAVQVYLWQTRVTILHDHGIIERYKSRGGIGWRIEVGPELVQGKSGGHASWCGGRVDLPRRAAKGRKKKVIKKSVVGTVGELGGGGGVLSICRRVLSQSTIADDEVGGNDIVRLILVDHAEISDSWTLATNAVTRWRHGDGASFNSGLGHLHELVAATVRKLTEVHTVQSINTSRGSSSSQCQCIAICAEPASDGRVGRKRDREGRDEVLSSNIALLDNKRVVDGNIPCAVIDGTLDERCCCESPLVASCNRVWSCQPLGSQRIGGNSKDTVLSECKACKQGSSSEGVE